MRINFGAGPSMIPPEVLKEAHKEFIDFEGSGISTMEASHRSTLYDKVHNEAIDLIRELYALPNEFDILFLQGGASMQFAMVPLNLYEGGIIEFADTGVWSTKAIEEAKLLGYNLKIVASSEDETYSYIPEVNFSNDADYAYITSNNTIYGTQYKNFPKTKSPLVVDASSDIFSYMVDWENVDLLFAGAQKNAGPSGITIVIIRKNLLERSSNSVPTMLRYKTHAKANSLYNTPPTFSIYLLNLTMKWIKSQGGIKKIEKYNQSKASLLYEALDNSNGFYVPHAKKESRSLMNVSFKLQDNGLESELLKEATKAGMIGLKGHRSVGGLRASIYNAMRIEGVSALCELLNEFAKKRG